MSDNVIIQGAAVPKDGESHSAVFTHQRIELGKQLENILKADTGEAKPVREDGKTPKVTSFSKQGVNLGRKPHPFNMRAVVDFQDKNVHHARCLAAKTAAMVGLGFHLPEEILRNVPIGSTDIASPEPALPPTMITEEKKVVGENGGHTLTTTVTHKPPEPNPNDPKQKDGKVKKLFNPANGNSAKPIDTGAPVDPNNPNADPSVNPNIEDPTAALIDKQRPSKADIVLDPLCAVSFQHLLYDVCEDYNQCGAGAIEVVRKGGPGTEITGLHHIPIASLFIFMEDNFYNYHYEVESGEGTGFARRFARWNDSEGLKKRALSGFDAGMDVSEATDGLGGTSEVIYFRRPSSKNRFYGYPDWLAAVTAVELVQCQDQYKYDFFNNRGVPEFMLFIIGTTLQPKEWDVIKTAVAANIGKGNSHKSVAINLSGDPTTVHVQLEKLAMEGVGSDDYVSSNDSLALKIVTAHGVPPLLAGIQIPGKLGANNELPNSLMSFHTLVCSPAQRLFRRVLSNTLGSKEARLGLTPDDFSFRTIVEEIDVGTLQTIGRMRQDLRNARAEGRPMDGTMKD